MLSVIIVMTMTLTQRASSSTFFRSSAFVVRQYQRQSQQGNKYLFSSREIQKNIFSRDHNLPSGGASESTYSTSISSSRMYLSSKSIESHEESTFTLASTSKSARSVEGEGEGEEEEEGQISSIDLDSHKFKSPWNSENLPKDKKRGVNKSRFRQHVNPLARKFQMPTDMISQEWPNDGTFTDPTLPLHIDIGCGKGGFLLSLAKHSLENEEAVGEGDEQFEKMNYLGLEIRPSVAQFAKERVTKRNLDGMVDFIGCNANVDLERILDQYTSSCGKSDGYGGEIALVSIQFPDPHFKKSHQKRRVVTPELVDILARYIPPGRQIFIQSDIKDVLDTMRLTIREEGAEYFTDVIEDVDEYMAINPVGVPTEREVSVLDQDLPVFRTVFERTEKQKVK